MKSITYILFLCCILISCSSNHQNVKIEKALILAGKNRSTLENVLKHYKDDSLKYQAACFLIENMPYHYSLEEYFLSPKGEKYRPNICNFKNANDLQKHCDSLINVGYKIEQNLLYDIETISEELLLNNIELAFKVWKKPWNENVSFEDFCKYILPYKAQVEQLSNLREKMMMKFLPILDSAKVTTPLEACKTLNKHLSSVVRYKETGLPFYPTIEEVYKSGISRCEGICNLGIYIMRAVGIPVTVDFTIWTKMDLGHSWCAVLNNGRFYSFGPGEDQPEIHAKNFSLIRHRRPAKVYRFLYDFQFKKSYNKYTTFLENPFLQDVTHEYLDTPTSFHVPVLNKNESINDDIFLCAYNYYEWKPLALGKYKTNGTCYFENVVGDNIFIVAKAVNDKIIKFITAPFYVNRSGNIHLLIPNYNKKFPFTLKKKISGEPYILQYWDTNANAFTSIPYIESTDTSQTYKEIPDNALFWFITPKRIVNQRIFIIDNDTIRYY